MNKLLALLLCAFLISATASSAVIKEISSKGEDIHDSGEDNREDQGEDHGEDRRETY